MINSITGNLFSLFEQGMDGVIWMVKRDKPLIESNNMYSDLVPVDEGDHLTVYSESGEIVFDSLIAKDITSNKYSLRFNNLCTQQVANGFYCLWLQQGFDPSLWGEMFENNLKATLIKNKYSKEEVLSYKNINQKTNEKTNKYEVVFNECQLLLTKEKPERINTFTEITPENYKNIDHYNGRMLYCKAESLLYAKGTPYIWLRLPELLEGLSSPIMDLEYASLNDEKFKELTNNITLPYFSKEDKYRTKLPEKVVQREVQLTSNDVDIMIELDKEIIDEQANFFKELKQSLKVFKIIIDNKTEYGVIIKFDIA